MGDEQSRYPGVAEGREPAAAEIDDLGAAPAAFDPLSGREHYPRESSESRRDKSAAMECKRPAPAAAARASTWESVYWTLSSIRAAEPREMSAAIAVKIVRSCPAEGLL